MDFHVTCDIYIKVYELFLHLISLFPISWSVFTQVFPTLQCVFLPREHCLPHCSLSLLRNSPTLLLSKILLPFPHSKLHRISSKWVSLSCILLPLTFQSWITLGTHLFCFFYARLFSLSSNLHYVFSLYLPEFSWIWGTFPSIFSVYSQHRTLSSSSGTHHH